MKIGNYFSTCSARANYGLGGSRKLADAKLVNGYSCKKTKNTGDPNQRRLHPSIYIVKTNNIIFTQILPALHFDHD